jgi:hypothetical protein
LESEHAVLQLDALQMSPPLVLNNYRNNRALGGKDFASGNQSPVRLCQPK